MSRIEMDEETTPTESVADAADVFRIAYALVKQHEWQDPPTVLDVIRVAEFLAEGVDQ